MKTWRFPLAVVLVTSLGLAFRLPGLAWGLPLKYAHIDESVVLFYALRVVDGAWNPQFYDYPGFFLYLLAGLIRLVATLRGWVQGIGWESLAARYLAGDADFFTLSARGLTLAFALLTIGLTLRMGRRWVGLWVGVGAAALLAVNPLHLRVSHYGTVDVAACFLTLLSMGWILQFGETRALRDGALAGLWVGLAAATKYYPGVLAVPLILLPFAARHPRPGRAAACLMGAIGTGFFFGSPFTVLSAGDFMARFAHLAPKIVGVPGHSVPFVQTILNLWKNAGFLCFILGLGGMVWALRQGGSARLLAVLWGTLFGFLGLWAGQAPHYSLALYPPLFLFASGAVFHLLRRVRAGGAVLLLVLVGLALPDAFRELKILRKPDTRLRAGQWVRENLPPGTKILRFAHTPEFRVEDSFLVKVDFTNQRLLHIESSWETVQKSLMEFDVLIYSSYRPVGDPVQSKLDQHAKTIHRESGPTPQFPHHPEVTVYAWRGNPS